MTAQADRVQPVDYIVGYTFTVADDTFMLLTIGIDDRLFAASSSRAGRWYEIIDNKCSCEAATHGIECHHMRNLKAAARVATEAK